MVDAPPLESGHIVAGRYRIESRIGQGGMGSVYLVRHVHTDESLALKVLHAHVLRDESAVERFRREARAPARVASEHVARVTDADTAPDLDGAPFYVMELLRGRDLERILIDDGPLAPVLLVEYLRQAARALDKAHAMGIVHRDLKPENLFLTEREDGSPCIKLLDFGIARLWEADAPGQLKTQSGYVFGTPAYLSPEQAMGKIELVGPATDVWALGLLTFKLLVGKEFWGANSLAHLYAMILSEPIPPPSTKGSSFGPAFDAWFLRCLARDGAERFPAVGEAVVALADALGIRMRLPRQSSASLVAATPYAPEALPSSQTRRSVASLPDAPSHAALSPSAPSRDEPSAPFLAARKSRAVPLAIGIGALVLLAVVIGVAIGLRDSPKGLVASASAAPPPATVASAAAASEPGAASAADPSSGIVLTPLAAAAAGDPRAPVPREGSRMGTAPAGKPTTTRAAASTPEAPMTRDQRRRLETLQRLCDQGTFTPTECKTKRLAIMQGLP